MNTQTLEQMKQLRLHECSEPLTPVYPHRVSTIPMMRLIAYLMQSEWDDRQNRKIERLTKSAKFRYSAVMENIDYDPNQEH